MRGQCLQLPHQMAVLLFVALLPRVDGLARGLLLPRGGLLYGARHAHRASSRLVDEPDAFRSEWESRPMPRFDYEATGAPLLEAGSMLAGVAACRRQNAAVLPLLAQLKRFDFFSLFSVDLLSSCSYMPTEEAPCDLEGCDIEPARRQCHTRSRTNGTGATTSWLPPPALCAARGSLALLSHSQGAPPHLHRPDSLRQLGGSPVLSPDPGPGQCVPRVRGLWWVG